MFRHPNFVRRFLPAVFLFLSAAISPCLADRLTLENGDAISGTITGIEGGKIIVKSATLGTVRVPVTSVDALTTAKAVAIKFADGTYATGQLQSSGIGRVRLIGQNNTSGEFALSRVQEIYPDGHLPASTFKWTGHANLGLSRTSGNTDNQAYNFDAKAVGRGEKDRITFIGEYNLEKSNGQDTVDNQFASAKYDRFLSKKWYIYGTASGERDAFQDLRLRSSAGVGAGYQIIETKRTHLSFEAGPSYVNEDFETAPDTDYTAGRWATDFSIWLFDDLTQFFHTNEGLVRLENTSDYLVRTRTGFRVPLREHLNATAQVNWDYDNEPAPGNDNSDTAYIVSVGYNW